MYRLRLLVFGALISGVCAYPSFADQTPPPPPENDPIYMRVVATPWPSEAAILVGNGRKHSAYELYVTNFSKTPLKITGLNVQGQKDDQVVMTQSASGKQLAAMFVPGAGGDATKPNDPTLQPGSRHRAASSLSSPTSPPGAEIRTPSIPRFGSNSTASAAVQEQFTLPSSI